MVLKLISNWKIAEFGHLEFPLPVMIMIMIIYVKNHFNIHFIEIK